MWNNLSLIDWQSLWQNVSYRRFAIALLLSALLHLFLISQFYTTLAYVQDDRSVIEARLLPLPVLLKAVPAKPMLKPVGKEKLILPTSEVTAVEEFKPADPPLLSDARSVIDQVVPMIAGEAVPLARPPDDVTFSDAVEDASEMINPNAYRYVETEFDVRTSLDAKVDGGAAGKAKIVYQLLPEGTHYQLKSLIQARGLAALLIPDLLQTSDGLLSSAGLQPIHYLYQFGDKKNKTFSADFNWEQKQLNLHSANGYQTLALAVGTQDLLSFMYQFMFVAPLQNMQLSITNGKKIGIYDYSFAGEELLATRMGNINTIHLVRMAAEGEKKTELWLALDYQYVPVKIRETEKQGKVYELLATSLKTELPAPKPSTP